MSYDVRKLSLNKSLHQNEADEREMILHEVLEPGH